MENNQDPESIFSRVNTELRKACYHNNDHVDLELVQRLLNDGADINTTGKFGWTCLMHTAVKRKEATELLIKNKASLDMKNKEGDTALIKASQFFQPAIVELLLLSGAVPDILSGADPDISYCQVLILISRTKRVRQLSP